MKEAGNRKTVFQASDLYDTKGNLHLESISDPELREIATGLNKTGLLPTAKTVYSSPEKEQRAMQIAFLHGVQRRINT